MTNALRANSEQELLEVWQHHVHSEFVLKDAKRALTTMSSNPHVLFVPIATGGRGREGVLRFYRDYFLAQLPADIRPIVVSQVVGKDILVEEAVYRFTHDQVMDWFAPGVAPTRKSVEIGVVAIVKFENAKIASEHVTGIKAAFWPSWASSIRRRCRRRAQKPPALCWTGQG